MPTQNRGSPMDLPQPEAESGGRFFRWRNDCPAATVRLNRAKLFCRFKNGGHLMKSFLMLPIPGPLLLPACKPRYKSKGECLTPWGMFSGFRRDTQRKGVDGWHD